MMISGSIKRTMPVDPDKFGNTKRMKVVYVENNEKKDTELMTSPGKVKLDKNSPTRTKRKAQDEKKEPPKKKSSSPAGRSSQELSAIMEEMVIFLTGESSNERSRYAKAIKFPSKLYYVMECGKFNDIISWTRAGTALTVIDLPAFTTKVLSVIFGGGSKFTSFHRKLNRWSFVKVPGAKETYCHPHFRRGRYAECQRITCSGVRGINDVDAYNFEASSSSSLRGAAVVGHPTNMMPLNIYNNPTTSTALGRSVAGNYYDTKAALLFPNRLRGSAIRKEGDSFGTFLSPAGGLGRYSEDSSSQEQGLVGGGMDNASFLPPGNLEYMRSGIVRARLDDCRGQSVSAAGLVVDSTLAHNDKCFQDVQAREQFRIDNAMIMARDAAAARFDCFAASQSLGRSIPTSRYSSNNTNSVLDQERIQTRSLNIHTNARMQPSHYLAGAHQQEHQEQLSMLQMHQRRQMQMQTMSTMNQMDQHSGLDQETHHQYQMQMFASQQQYPGMPSEQSQVSITEHAV